MGWDRREEREGKGKKGRGGKGGKGGFPKSPPLKNPRSATAKGTCKERLGGMVKSFRI